MVKSQEPYLIDYTVRAAWKAKIFKGAPESMRVKTQKSKTLTSARFLLHSIGMCPLRSCYLCTIISPQATIQLSGPSESYHLQFKAVLSHLKLLSLTKRTSVNQKS